MTREEARGKPVYIRIPKIRSGSDRKCVWIGWVLGGGALVGKGGEVIGGKGGEGIGDTGSLEIKLNENFKQFSS